MPASRRSGRFGRSASMAQAELAGERSRVEKALADEPSVQVRILQNAPVDVSAAKSGQVYSGQVLSMKASLAKDLVEQGVAEASREEDEKALGEADGSALEREDAADGERVEELMALDKNALAVAGQKVGVKDATRQGKDGLAVDIARAEAGGAEKYDFEASVEDEKAEQRAGRSEKAASSARAEYVEKDNERVKE